MSEEGLIFRNMREEWRTYKKIWKGYLFYSECYPFKGVSKWIEALRSGDYKQGNRLLRDIEDNYCCLGVLCEVMGVPVEPKGSLYLYDQHPDILPPYIFSDTPLNSRSGAFSGIYVCEGTRFSNLAMMNDHGLSFEVIADILDTIYFDPEK